jgi:hypothetical protein
MFPTLAGELVRRDDAVHFLHAVHHLEHGQVELALAAHAAEQRVNHAGGAVHIEAHLHQAVDHRLDLRLGGALLHHDYHVFSPGSGTAAGPSPFSIRKR